MITFSQQLSESDHKKAIRVHFFSYKFTYIGFALGIVLLSFLCFYFLIVSDAITEGSFILTSIGLFWILRPYLYANRVYKMSMANPLLNVPCKIEISDEEKIIVTVGDNSSTTRISALSHYRHKDPFLMLYTTKDQYLIIDRRQMGVAQFEECLGLLKRLGVKKK